MREVREPTDVAEVKAAIRLAAMKLFLQDGFKVTTLEEVAQAADVPPSVLRNPVPGQGLGLRGSEWLF